ncbi:SirB2 family protein, partial [Vibrio cholerae]|nr:SirB2 family protein [Vibrio cholerae]
MYEGLKHFHLFTIGVSVVMLSIRYVLMMMNSAHLERKFFKIFPHVNDTLLLLSGIGLIFITGFIPFTAAAPWMTEKFTCVLAYIALGFFALKLGRNKLLR